MWGWYKRAGTVCEMCVVSGPGLHAATARQIAVFTIEARDAEGNRQQRGEDSFSVTMRLVKGGETVRARVLDNGDGTYTVGYKAYTSGVYSISVALLSDYVRRNATPLHQPGHTTVGRALGLS